MPISKKPGEQPPHDSAAPPDETAIQAIIHKGGSVPTDTPHEEDVALKNLQLRLYPDQIEAIDRIIARKRGQTRRRKQSRHGWLVEAIEEKIERESQT